MPGDTRTYLDTGVLIAAWRGDRPLGAKSRELLDSTGRIYIHSVFLELELLPKPTFNKFYNELEFYKMALGRFERVAVAQASLENTALKIAGKYGLAAMDAIHIAAAIEGKAEEFITTEKSGKPICRATEISVVSLRSCAGSARLGPSGATRVSVGRGLYAAGVRLFIGFLQAFGRQVSVYLRGAEALVAQQFLHGPQVRTMVEHVRGETVPQSMRADVWV